MSEFAPTRGLRPLICPGPLVATLAARLALSDARLSLEVWDIPVATAIGWTFSLQEGKNVGSDEWD